MDGSNEFPCEAPPTKPKRFPRSYIDIGRNLPSARDAWQKGNYPIHEKSEDVHCPPEHPVEQFPSTDENQKEDES